VESQSLLCEPHVSSTTGQHGSLGGRLVLALGESERRALIRALYVVKDNWWLDETEEALLRRLESPALAG
jgi:hypothetical protein